MDSQQNTEPVDWDSQDSGFQESQVSQSSQLEYWGRLYPLKASLQKIDLVNNSVKIGVSRFKKIGDDLEIGADVILSQTDLPRNVFLKCSRVHFEIKRQEVKVLDVNTTQVRIIDRSTNGTYINSHCIKRKSGVSYKYRVLKTNDIIGFPDGKATPNYDAYIFVDLSVSISSHIPYSVRKDYQITVRLGAGTFGEVSLVFQKETGKPCAMKTIMKDLFACNRMIDSQQRKLHNELVILQSVKHPNVIGLVDVLDCKKEHFLILEYMEGNDLEHRLEKARENGEKLHENLAKLYFYQILQGVQYLHRQGIIHRDLKPANILLASTQMETILKITDFGLSKVLSPATMMKTLCGTKMYIAPEVIVSGGSYEYTEQVDVWSMGVILYLCLSGVEPFYSESGNIDELIIDASFSMENSDWDIVSKDAKILINRLLTKDPDERIKVREIYHTHWMQDEIMIEKANDLYSVLDSTMNSSSSMVVDSTFSSSNIDDENSLAGYPSPPPKKRRTM